MKLPERNIEWTTLRACETAMTQLGIPHPARPVSIEDTGSAYVVHSMGKPAAVVFWSSTDAVEAQAWLKSVAFVYCTHPSCVKQAPRATTAVPWLCEQHSTPTKNENALVNMACPVCKELGPFEIEAEALCLISDDGVEDYLDTQWTGESFCQCLSCDYAGTVADFTTEPK